MKNNSEALDNYFQRTLKDKGNGPNTTLMKQTVRQNFTSDSINYWQDKRERKRSYTAVGGNKCMIIF